MPELNSFLRMFFFQLLGLGLCFLGLEWAKKDGLVKVIQKVGKKRKQRVENTGKSGRIVLL